jgi:hypothetical protein
LGFVTVHLKGLQGFKKYSRMKREALGKINRQANGAKGLDTAKVQ